VAASRRFLRRAPDWVGTAAALHDQVVAPIAVKKTQGAWYRQIGVQSVWMAALDVADTRTTRSLAGRRRAGDQRLPASALRVFGWKTGRTYVRHENERLWETGKSRCPQGMPAPSKEGMLWSGRSPTLMG